jgi:hypothetical protein
MAGHVYGEDPKGACSRNKAHWRREGGREGEEEEKVFVREYRAMERGAMARARERGAREANTACE